MKWLIRAGIGLGLLYIGYVIVVSALGWFKMM